MDSQHTLNRSLLAEKLIERLSGQVRGRPLAEARTLADLRKITPDALPILAPTRVRGALATTQSRPSTGAGPLRVRAESAADGEALLQLADSLAGLCNRIDDVQQLREAICLRAILDSLIGKSQTNQQLLAVSFQGGSGAVSTFEMARGERLLSIIAALGGDRPSPEDQPNLQVIVGGPGFDFEVLTDSSVAPQTLSCAFTGEGRRSGGSGSAEIRIRFEGVGIGPADVGNQLEAIKGRLEHPELLLLD